MGSGPRYVTCTGAPSYIKQIAVVTNPSPPTTLTRHPSCSESLMLDAHVQLSRPLYWHHGKLCACVLRYLPSIMHVGAILLAAHARPEYPPKSRKVVMVGLYCTFFLRNRRLSVVLCVLLVSALWVAAGMF
jgi:hypothetical protein